MGVGLTRPPLNVPVVAAPIVPRSEFDFDQKTPPAMDPNTYHAMQTMRAEVLNVVGPILTMLEQRELREADERERRRKYIVPVITALGAAIAAILAAIVHGCS